MNNPFCDSGKQTYLHKHTKINGHGRQIAFATKSEANKGSFRRRNGPVEPFVQPLTLKFPPFPAARTSEDTFGASARGNCFAWKCQENRTPCNRQHDSGGSEPIKANKNLEAQSLRKKKKISTDNNVKDSFTPRTVKLHL